MSKMIVSDKKTILIGHPVGAGGDFLGHCINFNLKNTWAQWNGFYYADDPETHNGFRKKKGSCTFVDSIGHSMHIHYHKFIDRAPDSIENLVHQDQHIIMTGVYDSPKLYEYFPNSYHIEVLNPTSQDQKQFLKNRTTVDGIQFYIKQQHYKNKMYISLDFAKSVDNFMTTYNNILGFCNLPNDYENVVKEFADRWIELNREYWP